LTECGRKTQEKSKEREVKNPLEGKKKNGNIQRDVAKQGRSAIN